MKFYYKVVAIFVMLFLLVIGIMIITGVTSKAGHASDYLGMQLGIG